MNKAWRVQVCILLEDVHLELRWLRETFPSPYMALLEHACRAANEVESVLEGRKGQEITPSDLNDLTKLPFLAACVKETLRLFNTAVGAPRVAVKDTQLGDYAVPAGTICISDIYALHRNEVSKIGVLIHMLHVLLLKQWWSQYFAWRSGENFFLDRWFAWMASHCRISGLILTSGCQSDSCQKGVQAWDLVMKGHSCLSWWEHDLVLAATLPCWSSKFLQASFSASCSLLLRMMTFISSRFANHHGTLWALKSIVLSRCIVNMVIKSL